MWTCCIHSLCHWILLVILVQLHGNWCWMLSGSGTLPGWSCKVECWSRIWLVRTLMNVELLSWWVKLLCWGWLCQSQPHLGCAPAYGTTDWWPKHGCLDGTLHLQWLPKSKAHTARDRRQTSWQFPCGRRDPREC